VSRTWHHGDKAKQRLFGNEWAWLSLCPAEWNRIFHTKPKRAMERKLLHKVREGHEDQVWPLGSRKPHEYYY